MAESDDEYDRKRRDKFRGERSSGDSYRSERRNDDRSRGREDWSERGRTGRPDYRDYRPRDRFSPDRGGPPAKRMRNDWGDDGRPRYGGKLRLGHEAYVPYVGGWGGHDHYPMHGSGHAFSGHPPAAMHGRGAADAQNNTDLQTQPAMLTLKQFLATQDDSISDSDAITKILRKRFKIKYHPEESAKRKEEQLEFLKNRATVFADLLENSLVANVNVDTTQTDQLLRLLDTAVIKLEGGTDDDLKILDEKVIEIKPMDIPFKAPSIAATAPIISAAAPVASTAAVDDDDWGDIPAKVPIVRKKGDDEENWDEEEVVPAKPVRVNPFARKIEKPIDDDWNDIPAKIKPIPRKQIEEDDDDWGDISPKIKPLVRPKASADDDDWGDIPSKIKPVARKHNADEENWDDDLPPAKVAPVNRNNKKAVEDDWDDDVPVKSKPMSQNKNWEDDKESRNKSINKTVKVEDEDWSIIPNKIKSTGTKQHYDENNWDDEDVYADERNKKSITPEPIKEPDIEQINTTENKMSRKRARSASSSSSSSSSSDSENEENDDDDEEEEDKKKSSSGKTKEKEENITDAEEKAEHVDEDTENVEKLGKDKDESFEDEEEKFTVDISEKISDLSEEIQKEKKKVTVETELLTVNDDEDDVEMINTEKSIEDKETTNDTIADLDANNDEANQNKENTDDGDDKKDEDKVETIDLDKESDPKETEPGPRALHKTSSIFLRNLAPTITKAEVETMCKRYNGFLRVAIADPLVERRWFRRGWVTFQRDVNIKEICWNLNNVRLRDCELGAIVNRDLSRRVRPINGITAHKTIVRSDIKLCAKIAFNLDLKAKLWQSDENTKAENGNLSFGLNSNNPVLQNITDYLIEEASAEEDELLGLSTRDTKDTEGELLERDPDLIAVLDRLILYLRIVHSVDFYNHCEYPYEDEMPNRLGIIHARGPAPQNKVTSNEIQDYIRNFEGKMSSFLVKSQPIEEEEVKKLGCKDTDAEVEKFVQANTQELAKDKWLCPLSGKKFKGPDFIRKHIFNKHGEKVDEVKKEVEYFNNYLKDVKRPQLPEHPGNIRKPPMESQPQAGYRPGYLQPMYSAPYAAYAPPMVVPPRPRGGGFGGRRGGGGGGDYRPIIHYRDLDAPREPDDFL